MMHQGQSEMLKKGQFVGFVDLIEKTGPIEVPLPKHWYMLRTHPSRESKVMKAFKLRNISGYLPVMVTTQNVTRYRRGFEWIEPRSFTSPMISGVVLIPDFELDAQRWKDIEGTAGILRFGDFTPRLTPRELQDIRNIEAIANTPRSKREHLFKIGQLVRVVSGPFRSFCARVERIDSRGRLSVGVEIFQRVTPIELDKGDIEPV